MPLTLNTPIVGATPVTVSFKALALFVDFVAGTAVVTMQGLDKDGSNVGGPFNSDVPEALLDARLTELEAAVYEDFQKASGLTGMVT